MGRKKVSGTVSRLCVLTAVVALSAGCSPTQRNPRFDFQDYDDPAPIAASFRSLMSQDTVHAFADAIDSTEVTESPAVWIEIFNDESLGDRIQSIGLVYFFLRHVEPPITLGELIRRHDIAGWFKYSLRRRVAYSVRLPDEHAKGSIYILYYPFDDGPREWAYLEMSVSLTPGGRIETPSGPLFNLELHEYIDAGYLDDLTIDAIYVDAPWLLRAGPIVLE